MKKMYLNDEMVLISKSLLLKEDVSSISNLSGYSESTICKVIAGKMKTDCKTIDVIQKIVKMRHYQQRDAIWKNEETIKEQC